MADFTFNQGLGRPCEYASRVANNDPANSALVIVLLKVVEADNVLEDYDTLAAILAAPGNTEADFTNYARIVFDDTDISEPVPNDTNNTQSVDMPDPVWVSAGGITDNNLVKLLVCFDSDTTGGTDANLVPLTAHDFVITTNGNDLTGAVNAAGFFTASKT